MASMTNGSDELWSKVLMGFGSNRVLTKGLLGSSVRSADHGSHKHKGLDMVYSIWYRVCGLK